MASPTNTVAGLNALLHGLSLDPMPKSASPIALTRPVEIWRSYLAEFLSELSILNRDATTIQEAIASTTETSLGDLTLILPRLKLKDVDNKALNRLAFSVAAQLPFSSLFLAPRVDDIQLRMTFSPDTLPRLLLPYIADRKSAYGFDLSQGLRDPKEPKKGKKKIIIEFSSPSVAIGFNGNNLRSTLLGDFIANLYEAMGWEVVRLNYLADWGKHVSLLAAGYKRFGSEKKLQQERSIYLLDVYAQMNGLFKPVQDPKGKAKQGETCVSPVGDKMIASERDEIFKKMEDGDNEALKLSSHFRDITIEDLKVEYQRLGITFDEYSGESQVRPATITEVENTLKEKGILTESNGSWVIDWAKHTGKKGFSTQVIRGRDGATRYPLRDVAAALEREEKFAFDKMIYVASSAQDSHFQQVLAALELMGRSDLSEKLQHISFGAMQGLEANSLREILDNCEARMRDAMNMEHDDDDDDGSAAERITNNAMVGALLAQEMSKKKSHGYTFELKKLTSFSSHSGPMLQGCHTRLMALINELRAEGVEGSEIDYAALKDPDCANLLRVMAQFPDVVAATYKSAEPHSLLGYLYRLMDSLSLVVPHPDEDDDEDERESVRTVQQETSRGEQKARLVLYQNARQVLENGMKLLGFPLDLQDVAVDFGSDSARL
ncbi:Arginine--tRNA ligase [Fusarium falciforme]|uniref:Arginine--tRNA ligase n=1 Tax=Fusarium falciforme TaxID=195108 RepID=UPI0023008AE2|nr:Arginine--tRNA ligase [Fusarium falciforme]WAO87699.1 Arginine--tRNA ligase [Fusarium falciforme]